MAQKKKPLTIPDRQRIRDTALLRMLKSLKVTKADALATIGRGIDALASEGQWRPSEIAMAKAHFERLAVEVWK